MRLKYALALLCLSFGFAAEASTVVYQGTLKSRQQCKDTGGMFATDLGCKALPMKDRNCTLELELMNNSVRAVSVSVPEILLNRESKKKILSTSLKGPYLLKDGFLAYSKNFDKDAAIEFRVDSRSLKALEALVYTNHVFLKDGNRTFKMYTCSNFKRIK